MRRRKRTNGRWKEGRKVGGGGGGRGVEGNQFFGGVGSGVVAPGGE